MSSIQYLRFGGSQSFRFGDTEVRQIVMTDISAEAVVESMGRVHVFGRVNSQTPRFRPMPSKFRKRLAGVR